MLISQKHPKMFYQITGHPVTFTHKINHHISLLSPSPLCLILIFQLSDYKESSPPWPSTWFKFKPTVKPLIALYILSEWFSCISVFICEIICLICIFPTKLGDPEGQGLLWLVHHLCYIEHFVVCLTQQLFYWGWRMNG